MARVDAQAGADAAGSRASDGTEQRVCEIHRRGRLVTAEPWFEGSTPVAVESRRSHELTDGDLVLLRIPTRGRAQVVEAIGPSTQIECVLEGLLLERGARWANEADADAAEAARMAAAEPTDHVGRVDLRDLTTVTIDPDSARDFDDAISAAEEGSGWRVWVHIADVAAYVRPDTALDRWAQERAFSTYVPGRVSPMLPEALSTGSCSLQPDRDRWCITVELALSADALVEGSTLYRSVIRSDARLTYGEAENTIQTQASQHGRAVASIVSLAASISERLRERRFRRGAMRLERPELVLELDGEGGVTDASWQAEHAAHALIEELMILANETVAEFLERSRADTLYRIHPDPDPQAIVGLIGRLAALDVATPPEPEHLTRRGAAGLAARLAETVASRARTPGAAEALSSLVLRSLEQASYHKDNRGHSGLASSAYCHFTSPIRRYPDLVVHRALLARLGVDDAPGELDLETLGQHCSVRERELAAVEYRANDICLAWLLDRVLYEEGWDAAFDAEIIGLIASGLFVRFGEVFEGYLPARALPGDYFELDELGVSLSGRRSGRRFRLGDSLSVQVDTLDRADGRVRLALSQGGERGVGSRSAA